jgi:hypothetical protein
MTSDSTIAISKLRALMGGDQVAVLDFEDLAVERLKGCDNIVALSERPGVHRRLLYKLRDQLEPVDDGQAPPENSKERELRLQVAQLKRLVADKTLEADFFKGALQKSRGSTPGQHATWRDGIASWHMGQAGRLGRFT